MAYRNPQMSLLLEPPTGLIYWTLHFLDLAGEGEGDVTLEAVVLLQFYPRFDRLVYLGISEDLQARVKILAAITRK